MIKLTKISGEQILINHAQIELIEAMPESKIVMNSGAFYIVREDMDTIIQEVIEFKARVRAFEKQIICKN